MNASLAPLARSVSHLIEARSGLRCHVTRGMTNDLRGACWLKPQERPVDGASPNALAAARQSR